jgi:hypothetical protein|nr:hypothetical protein [Desulfosarcina alkanivorans]
MKMKFYRHAGTQGAMHPTATGDLQKPAALIGVQVADQFDRPINGIKLSQCGFSIRELHRVRSVVAELDADILQGDPFSLRIHAKCDRRSRTQCGQQERIGTRAPVGTAEFFRPVGSQRMPASLDHLSIALTCHRMNGDI